MISFFNKGGSMTLQEKEINITSNGIINIEPDTGYDGLSEVEINVNVSGGGADLSEYFNSSITSGTNSIPGILKFIKTIPSNTVVQGTSAQRMFLNCTSLITIPLIDTSNVTNMNQMFYNCSSLTTIALLDTSNVTNMNQMFQNCPSLTTVPLLNTSSVTNMNQIFQDCPQLTNDSLNNILAMCINSGVSAIKTLAYIGLTSTQATTCQSLSNYQDFLNAGWTTGY